MGAMSIYGSAILLLKNVPVPDVIRHCCVDSRATNSQMLMVVRVESGNCYLWVVCQSIMFVSYIGVVFLTLTKSSGQLNLAAQALQLLQYIGLWPMLKIDPTSTWFSNSIYFWFAYGSMTCGRWPEARIWTILRGLVEELKAEAPLVWIWPSDVTFLIKSLFGCRLFLLSFLQVGISMSLLRRNFTHFG